MKAGIRELVKNGGRIQIITSPNLSEEDIEAIEDGLNRRDEVNENELVRELSQGSFGKPRLNFLSNLIASGRLEIKIATMKSATGKAMFHDKFGLMHDAKGNVIAFSGSLNETFNGLTNNYEAIDVFTSWTSDADRVKLKEKAFDLLWNNRESGAEVSDLTTGLFGDETSTESDVAAEKVAVEAYERAVNINKTRGLPGVTTGLLDLDRVTNGLQKGELILLAARPSMGKTALALNMAKALIPDVDRRGAQILRR